MAGITDSERGIATRRPNAGPKRRDPDPDAARGTTRPGPPTAGRGNPGSLVGTESRNGLVYARYRAKPGTWVSSSMAELGYDRLYGKDTAYGAYTGIVLDSEGRQLQTPDRIEPGQEYLIPIGSGGRFAGGKSDAIRPGASVTPAPDPAPPPSRSGTSTGRGPADYTRQRAVPQPAVPQRAADPRSSATARQPLGRPMNGDRATVEAPRVEPPKLYTSGAATSKCYTPYPIDPRHSDLFGVIAHVLIQDDYVRTAKLKRHRNVWTDDTFAGTRNKKYSNFMINKNLRSLTPAQKARIKAYRGQRPDILLDTGAEKGFEEIKPAHPAAIDKGVEQVEAVARFMQANNLPYALGTSYTPKAELPVVDYLVAGEVVEVYLKCERKQGLIVYHYCLRADWTQLKRNVRKALDLFIKIMVVLLALAQYGRTPGTNPPGQPQLPEPSPIPDPIGAPPEKVPVSTSPSGFIPDSTLRALQGLPLDVLISAGFDNDIVFEPYIEH